jgi:hypothetical protein
MKFGLSNKQLDYFNKNQAIEFEGLLSSVTVDLMNQEIAKALSTGLKKPISEIEKHSPFTLYKAGRDFWRRCPEVKKAITGYQLLNTIATLTDQKLLRLGFDQFIPTITSAYLQEPSYLALIDRQATMAQISSLQDIVAGLIICLQDDQEPVEIAPKFFPKSKGNVVIFHPQAEINFRELLKVKEASYLLVTYTRDDGVFVFNPQDVQGNHWRDLGYNPGDRLKEKLNPIVYRG